MTDLNEMAENAKKREEALDALAELSQEMEKHREEYEAANDAWWNGLTEQEREDAFYAVVKRMHKAELKDRGTYRWALYDVFGFDGGMYMKGMNCGYMALHNAIGDGEDYQAMRGVNRFEVIDDKGRTYVKYLKDDERVRYMLQDDDRTLKVFIDKVTIMNLEDL
jgi:hypothetical protein